jgi:glycosyltransferase involved in cell wall biosynthesis
LTRIIYFSRDYSPHDHRFLAALADTRYEVFYLRLENKGIHLEDRPVPTKVKQISWSEGTRPAGIMDGPRLLLSLRRVIKSLKPDLFHAGPIQQSAFLVALVGFKPLVSMSWGYDLLQDANRNKLWRKATRYTLRNSAVMVGDCDAVRRKAIEFGMLKERIVIFPWGVDLNTFKMEKNPPAENENFTLLSTRAWEPIYGVDILVSGFLKAAKQQKGLRLILLGSGSQASYLQSIFMQGGMMDRVILPGCVPHSDLPHYYHMADIYVSASHVDGSSVSLMEAMACGKPAIVSDIPGNREWVEDGVNGWWFRDGDSDHLAEAILKAVNQRRLLRDMGLAARQQAVGRADWEKNFPNLLHAYEIALQM